MKKNKALKSEYYVDKSYEKKRLTIVVSIASIIVLSVVIFFSIFFTVKFDLYDKIDDFFASSDTITYSNDYFITCEIPSSVAKDIVKEYYKGVKFKNNSDFRFYAGYHLYMYCGGKKITISSVFIDFTDKIYRCYNPVPTGSYEDLTKLYEELDKHSVVIEDRRNENLDEQ